MSEYYDLNYRRFLPEDRNAAIIDIGCGDGDFVRYAQGLGYRNITAVDIDTDALAPLAKLEGVRVIAEPADGSFVQTLPGDYVLIVVKQMIYYLTRREAPAFVAALQDKLADDGVLLVEIYNASLVSARFTQAKDPFIQTAYNEKGITRLLESQGLTVDELFGAEFGPGSIGRKLYVLIGRLWFKLWRAVLILERGRDDELPVIRSKSIIAIARR
jgi:SAM-dependent methyltransferase